MDMLVFQKLPVQMWPSGATVSAYAPGTEIEVPVVERWTGTYARAADRLMLVDRPDPTIRLVMVTSGTGASTAFAIAEEVLDELLGAG